MFIFEGGDKQPPFQNPMNKIFKIVIQFNKLHQNIQRN